MTAFIAALLAGIVISAISFTGLAGLLLSRDRLSKFLMATVAFAAGGLLGGAFFHLLPESLDAGGPTFPMALAGLIVFFLLDSFIWAYHCHAGHRLHGDGHTHCPPIKSAGVLNLIGDGVHNFTDGVIVASSFLVSIPLGIATSIAVALHEIPQELSDFGILVHSGFTTKKALVLNFVTALAAIIGIIAVFVAQTRVAALTTYTIPFAAGGFIYIACTNLLSEMREEKRLGKRLVEMFFFLLGLAFLWASKTWLGE
ncbi:ZIP family metal transporter [Candidatus Uhrbacteria bacterium]|nr:ZIP family metal transporter [Candidatus Uhrbacteria bacterium]